MKRSKGRVGTVALVFVLLLGLVMILAGCEDPLGAEDDDGNGNGITDPIDDDDANGDDNGDVVERSLPLSGTIAESVEFDTSDGFLTPNTSFDADGMEVVVYQMPADTQLGGAISVTLNDFSLTITVPDNWSQTFVDFLDGYGISEPDTTNRVHDNFVQGSGG